MIIDTDKLREAIQVIPSRTYIAKIENEILEVEALYEVCVGEDETGE